MKKRLFVAGLCALLWTWLSNPAAAQSVDATFAPLSLYQTAPVWAATQQADGKYIIAGDFNRINGGAGASLVRLNNDGTRDATFAGAPTTTGQVVNLTPLTGGQVLVASPGTFSAGGQTYYNLVRLTSSGAPDAGFSVGSGAGGGLLRSVTTQPDGKILVAGSFTTFNGVASPGLVRLNANGSVDQAFTTALGTGFTGGEVNVVAVESGGNILVGGRYTNFNGSGRGILVRLLPAGTLDTSYNPSMTATSFAVVSLALDPVTGQALVAGGPASGELSRLNTDGTRDMSFALNTTGSYCVGFNTFNSTRLLVDGQRRVLLARGCTAGSGTSGELLTRFLRNGTPDAQFNAHSQLNGAVNVVLRQADGQILLGGGFTRYGTLANASLVRVSDQAAVDATFHPLLDYYGSVQALALQPDGKVVVGGSFREVNGVAAGNLLRLNADGTPDAAFGFPVVDRVVTRLALQPDGKILLGGAFSTVNGTAAPMLARLLPGGALDASFQSAASAGGSSIRGLAVQPDGNILVGSNSNVTFGTRSALLHRLLPSGQPDATYAQNLGVAPNGSVTALELLPDGRHYVGGSFSRFNNVSVEGLVRLLPSGAMDPAFSGPAASASSRSIEQLVGLPGGGVLVGGIFSSFGGVSRTNLVELSAGGAVEPGLNSPMTGSLITALFRQPDGKLLVGGLGNYTVGGVDKGALFRLNADGTADPGFVTGPGLISPSVLALAVQPDGKLLVGGLFSTVSGQPYMGLVRLTAPNVLRVAANQTLARTQAWPNPVRHVLNLELDAAARPQRVSLLDAAGKVVKQQAATAAMRLDVSPLPAGLYLLRVDYASGPVTRRVVVE